MKKLLLLSAILIFACSSDDSSNNDDNSNQTFLERYDGVAWKSIDQSDSNVDDFWIIFNQNSWYSCGRLGPDCECQAPSNWGQVYEDGLSFEISEDSPERLVVLITDGGDYTFSVDATNNGNRIEVRWSVEEPNYVEYYDRVSEQPCE